MSVCVLTAGIFGLLIASPGNAQTAEFPDVPRDHWTYTAFQHLISLGDIDESVPGQWWGVIDPRAKTRYEWAVAIAQFSKMNPKFLVQATPPDALPKFKTQRDIVAALRREFESELMRLGARVG